MDESYLAEAIHKEAYPRMHVLIISASASCLILRYCWFSHAVLPVLGRVAKARGLGAFHRS
jgi:hypothetical protein